MTDSITQQNLLAATLNILEKKYGKGIVMRLGEQPICKAPVISTGSFGLDRALGVGGFPCGRITEIYGPESSGKTTLTLHAIAEVQRKGGAALFIDTEHAFDKAYATALGVDTENLMICQPDYGEQALEVANHYIRSNAIGVVVIDSVSALLPEAELKGEMGAHHLGGQARLMSQAMRKLASAIHKSGVISLFINQLRHKIGVTFGSPETTSGGNALKFYASIRLDIRKISLLKTGSQVVGHRVRIKVVKNKLSAPFQEVTFDLRYGVGICQVSEIIDHCLSLGLIEQAGSWFSYQEKPLGQGKEAMRDRLIQRPKLQSELLEKVILRRKTAYQQKNKDQSR